MGVERVSVILGGVVKIAWRAAGHISIHGTVPYEPTHNVGNLRLESQLFMATEALRKIAPRLEVTLITLSQFLPFSVLSLPFLLQSYRVNARWMTRKNPTELTLDG